MARRIAAVPFTALSLFVLFLAIPSQGLAGGLTAAHPFPEGSAVDAWAHELGRCAEERFGIPIEFLPGGALGRPEEVRDAVLRGQLDLAIVPVTMIGEVWPAAQLLATPGAVTSPQKAALLGTSSLLLDTLDRAGGSDAGLSMMAIAWQYQLLAVRSDVLDDFAGKRIRASGDQYGELLSMLGAAPVMLPRTEIPFALSFGAIDGSIVSAEEIPGLQGKGEPLTLLWSDTFTPFMTPLAVVMSAYSSRSWGEKLLFVMREECAEVTLEFNRRTIEATIAAVREASGAGISVQGYDEGRWSAALSEIFSSAAARLEVGDLAAQLNRQ